MRAGDVQPIILMQKVHFGTPSFSQFISSLPTNAKILVKFAIKGTKLNSYGRVNTQKITQRLCKEFVSRQ